MMIVLLASMAGAAATVAAPPAAVGVASRFARWEHHLRERVNDLLAYPVAAGAASGDVLVQFKIGPDGKPANILLRTTSGQPIFDRAALNLVAHLGRIGPVPSREGIREVILKLSYGDPSVTVADSMSLARADVQERQINQRRNQAIISGEANLAQR